jgi:O-antigen ligase
MQAVIPKITPWLWAAVWFTLPLSLKANGISLILFGSAVIVQAFSQKPVFDRKEIILAGLFILFFAWHGVSFFFDPAKYEVWKSLERKLSLVAIPVIMLFVNGKDWDTGKWAIRGFFAGLVVTGLHLLSVALFRMVMGEPISAFTYHEFTAPYHTGAIYYSCFLSVALYFLAFGDPEEMIRRFSIPLFIFFIILLLFSASKLFIVVTIPAILWPGINYFMAKKGIKRYILPLLVVVVIGAGSVPFFNRIKELKNTELDVVNLETFAYNTPLNGLTFRLVLWRFAGEIMQDQNAWLTGTGIGSRQAVLDSYYLKYGVYTGNPDLGDSGYLGYNFHSQYLEVLVGTGIPGLLILLAIIAFIFSKGSVNLYFPMTVYLIIVLFLVTESMLERQAGIVLFTLLWTLRANNPETSA